MRKSRRPLLLFLLLLLFPLLSGCWDTKEPEKLLHLYGIGVDYKDDRYEVYAQMIDFSNIAKSEQPNPEAVQAEIGYASGRTVEEAIFKLYHSVDLRVFWGHFNHLVFSEEALKNGRANPVINTFMRFRETRYQTWVYATNAPLEEVMLLTPQFNKALNLSKLSDPLNSYNQESYVEPINFRKLIIRLNEPGHEVNIPYVTVGENWQTAEEQDKAAEIEGVGVLAPDEFRGFVKGAEANGLQWLNKETERGEITIRLEGEEDAFLTAAINNLKIKVKPKVSDGLAKFDIHVKVDAIVSGFEGSLNEKEIKEGVTKKIKDEIERTYREGLKINADIFRLSEYLYRANVKEWKRLQADGKVELDEDSIDSLNVEVDKVSSGRKSFKETVE